MTISPAVILGLDAGAPDFCDVLFGYFADAGQSMYDEVVSQLEHGLQSAALAESDGCGPALQVAALLHDIGHLVLDEHDESGDFLQTDLRHEIVGARLVTGWFGSGVGGPIALHVPAKRYLVATDAEYAACLSPASVKSLAVQGGPMDTSEIEAFEQLPHHADAVRLRRWDDDAKIPGADVPPLEHWRPALAALLNRD